MAKLTKSEVIKMQIKRIEKEIRDTPYHKATEHHIGRLRAKLSKLKDQEMGASTKSGGGGGGYAVKKQGDATVVLVGPPSAGKSTLLNELTNAKSKIAPYAFTTVSVIPGMMYFNDARIQILDVPGLIEGAEVGKGRGREVLSVVRGADLLVLMTDVDRPKIIDQITQALEENGIRVNKTKPNVVVEKKLKGGIVVRNHSKTDLDNETIRGIAKEYGYTNAEITIFDKVTMDELIDVFNRNRVYIPAIKVVNKIDEKKLSGNGYIGISATEGKNLDKLRQQIWDKLGLVKIYLVKDDDKPNTDNPMITFTDTSLKEILDQLGTDKSEGKQNAKIWGSGAKHPGQVVSLKTKVKEGMQVKFV